MDIHVLMEMCGGGEEYIILARLGPSFDLRNPDIISIYAVVTQTYL